MRREGALNKPVWLNDDDAEAVSIVLMQVDFAARSAPNAASRQGQELSSAIIEAYHTSTFAQFGLSADAWTAHIPLVLAERYPESLGFTSGAEARSWLWSTMLDSGNFGVFDRYSDSFSIINWVQRVAQTYNDDDAFIWQTNAVAAFVDENWYVRQGRGSPYPPDYCFARGTLISLFNGEHKQVEEITEADLVLSYDSCGDIVPGRVIQLLHNVTDTWLHLSNGTYVTLGHRYLRPDGTFAEIQDIIAADGRIVAADGSIQIVTAEEIHYSAETAHLFEETEMLVYASEGSAALAPELKRGWKTYNFTVAETHTYIADGTRVHNDSVLAAVKAGDVLLSVDDALLNAAVLRDVNGDGRDEVVIFNGVRQPGENTIIVHEFTYSAPSNVSNVAAYVQNKMAAIDGDAYTVNGQTYTVDIYRRVFDPGRGNGYNGGRVSDDVDEILANDFGFGRQVLCPPETGPFEAEVFG